MKKTAEFEGLHSLVSEQIKNIKADLGRDESLFLHVRIDLLSLDAFFSYERKTIHKVSFLFSPRTSKLQRKGKCNHFHFHQC